VTELIRRRLLGAGACLAGAGLLGISTIKRASAATQIVITDPGGSSEVDFAKAYYEPFEKETGIKVAYAARPNLALGQLKAMVLAGRVDWNLTYLSDYLIEVAVAGNLLDKIDYSGFDKALLGQMLPGTITPYSAGGLMFATVMAHSNKTFAPGKGPKNWADFWDVKNFPGRRSMMGFGNGPMEQALLADGVPKDQLYPIDIPRALTKLDQIRSHIDVWTSSSAQQVQLMVNQEVDIIQGFANRLQSAINDGAPYTIVWQDGSYQGEQWVLPRGAGERPSALKFIEFALRPEPQAKAAGGDGTGPTNSHAIDFVPPELRPRLPTYPDNVSKMYRVDAKWLAENNDTLSARWTEWKAKAG